MSLLLTYFFRVKGGGVQLQNCSLALLFCRTKRCIVPAVILFLEDSQFTMHKTLTCREGDYHRRQTTEATSWYFWPLFGLRLYIAAERWTIWEVDGAHNVTQRPEEKQHVTAERHDRRSKFRLSTCTAATMPAMTWHCWHAYKPLLSSCTHTVHS